MSFRCTSSQVLYITEARIAAEPLSCSCCEAKSEGFERGSVREIGLCDLWHKPCISASYPHRHSRYLSIAQSARFRLPSEVTLRSLLSSLLRSLLKHFWLTFESLWRTRLRSRLKHFWITLEDTFWITFEAEDTFWAIPLEPDELPLHILSGSFYNFKLLRFPPK